jgi:iron complex transport system substrate-binding protein
VAQTEKAVADTKAANPGFAGRTFTIGPVQADGTINTISSDTDASARFMQELGLRLSPAVTSLPPGNFPGRAVVSPESLNAIDADVMILTYSSPDAQARLEANEVFKRIPAVQRGAYVALDLTTAIAIAFPSALSIPYAIEQSVSKIAAALSK